MIEDRFRERVKPFLSFWTLGRQATTEQITEKEKEIKDNLTGYEARESLLGSIEQTETDINAFKMDIIELEEQRRLLGRDDADKVFTINQTIAMTRGEITFLEVFKDNLKMRHSEMTKDLIGGIRWKG